MNTTEYNRKYRLKLKTNNPEQFEKYRQQQKKWQKNHQKKMRGWYEDYKSHLACEVCGETHISCLDFHHRNPKDKAFHIARSYHVKKIEVLIEEIAKCRVLCANCHRKLHYNLKRDV